MKTPLFTVAPCSITGHSLLRWQGTGKGPGSLRSVQMETEVAAFIAAACNGRAGLMRAIELNHLFHSRPFTRQSLEDFRSSGYLGTDDGREMREWLTLYEKTALAKAKEGTP